MAELYIQDEQLKVFAVANESDGTEVWELLADAVSRLFDRECEVSDGFFAPAGTDASDREFVGNGTRYVELSPYIAGTIDSIDVDGTEFYESDPADRLYREKEDFLIFTKEVEDGVMVTVSARWGFAAVPTDIQLACIEQALAMWRRKDMAFADISGVAAGVVNAEFTPTFQAATRRYRELYTSNGYFA